MNTKFINPDEGFTLIEMLIVVLILGIVSSIAVIGVTGAFSSSKVKACQTDVRSIDNAMQGFYNDNPNSNPTVDNAATSEETLYNSATSTAITAVGDLVKLGYWQLLDPNSNYNVHLQLIAAGTGGNPQYKVFVTKGTTTLANSYTKDSTGSAIGTYLDPCQGV